MVSKSADPLTRDRGFESGSLQQRVHVSRDFSLHDKKPGFFRGSPGRAGGRQRRIWCGDMAPNGGNISAGLNSSTAVSMIRWLNESGSGSSKAEHGSLIVPGKR